MYKGIENNTKQHTCTCIHANGEHTKLKLTSIHSVENRLSHLYL